VDPLNFIAESREFDNEVKATLTVASPPAPNLVMLTGNINVFPAQPVEGEDVTVQAIVLNTGNVDAEGVMVQFVDVTDGGVTPVGEQQVIATVPAGGSARVEVGYPTDGLLGERSIQVVVDPNNFVLESNEDDNEATRSLQIAAPAAPNLTILAHNITFEPPTPGQGDVVTITALVLNNGAAAATRILVQFIDVTNGGSTPIGVEQTIEAILPGGAASVRVVYDTAGLAGNRKIQVLVDSNNLIEETDEADNEAVVTLSVDPAPIANLVVTESNISADPAQPVMGDVVTVTVSVHNQGTAAAEEVVVHLLDVSDGEPRPVDTQTIESIAPGGAELVQITYEDGPGERRLRVVVDPSNYIPESDETDNRTTYTLFIEGALAPNLVVRASNIGMFPLAPVSGEPVTVTATILNNGNADAHEVLVQFV
jgi:subtilase family serine protease